jgi:hypothetical protein
MHRISRVLRLSILPISMAAVAAYAQYPGSVPVPTKVKPGFDLITESRANEFLSYLAGPECMGRGTGQPGYDKAAAYVADHFKKIGLKAIDADGDYLQPVPFIKSYVDPDKSSLTGPAGIKLKVGEDFGLTAGDSEIKASGLPVFLAADRTVNAITDLQAVKNRVVIVSGQVNFRLSRQLGQLGATAILSVVETVSNDPRITRPGQSSRRQSNGAVRGSITVSAVNRLAEASGVSADWMDAKPGTLQKGTGLYRIVGTTKSEEIGVPNVVGVLEGTDPELKHEHIGIGSHLDHLGVRNGVVYWGADDDGSGSAGVMLAAEALAKNPPKRSIVFMCFAAEEIGLIGSRYYADNPLMPLEDMVCLLQMDMISRNEVSNDETAEENTDTIHLVGSKRISTELHEITLKENRHVNLKFEYDQEGVYSRSDHANFARKGVPVTFLFSGFHPDYHQPTDTIDKVNFKKLVACTKLNYLVAQMVGNKPDRLKIDATRS